MIKYNSFLKEYKNPFGPVICNQSLTINIEIGRRLGAINVCLVLFDKTRKKSQKFKMNYVGLNLGYDFYKIRLKLGNPGVFEYYFEFENSSGLQKILRKELYEAVLNDGEIWQLSIIEKRNNPDNFLEGRVIYQIFPDRFYREKILAAKGKLEPYIIKNEDELPEYKPDSKGRVLNNDFFGGNFSGVVKKIDYLKDLGIEAIYFNPVVKAFSNHRYDTCDYMEFDPLLGTKKDFSDMCEKLHKNNIYVILDGVFSHTGSNSIYFDKEKIFGNGACSNNNSIYRNWYNFYEYPNFYESWWGIDTLPCVNELCESYISYIKEVIKMWMKCGADGIRLDVADELPDEFIQEIKKTIKSIKKDGVLIGEVWEDASNKESYGKVRSYFYKDELDSVMNYPLRSCIINFLNFKITAREFELQIMKLKENYPLFVRNTNMNSLSTHDTPRILTEFSEIHNLTRKEKSGYKMPDRVYEMSKRKVEMALAILFFMPGCPTIYYGDEIGMEGYEDPFNRNYFDWNKKDNIYDIYKRFIKMRKDNSALLYGDFILQATDTDTIKIVRESKRNKCTLNLNRKSNYEIFRK